MTAIYDLIHSLTVVCGEGHEMMVTLAAILVAFDACEFEALVATVDAGRYRGGDGNRSVRQSGPLPVHPYTCRTSSSPTRTVASASAPPFRAVAGVALQRGCNRVFWESVDENHKANAFY